MLEAIQSNPQGAALCGILLIIAAMSMIHSTKDFFMVVLVVIIVLCIVYLPSTPGVG